LEEHNTNPSLLSSPLLLETSSTTPHHTTQFSLGARAASMGPAVGNALQRGFATEGERERKETSSPLSSSQNPDRGGS
jgi:hypothetical protein